MISTTHFGYIVLMCSYHGVLMITITDDQCSLYHCVLIQGLFVIFQGKLWTQNHMHVKP
jgi:hypothetical protein